MWSRKITRNYFLVSIFTVWESNTNEKLEKLYFYYANIEQNIIIRHIREFF